MKLSARLPASVHNVTPEQHLRVGILGYSDIARRKFIPALLQSKKASLAAVGSTKRIMTESLKDGNPIAFMTYQDLVCDPAVDLIYLSLPNHLHEEWSVRALEQGKHVICEKPLALSADSAMRMLEAAERHGRLLFENLMYLQHPQHMAIKSLIASGRIGRILSLHVEFAFPGPPIGDFRLDPARGGGAFHDLNRYPLSAALHFLQGQHYTMLKGTTRFCDRLNTTMAAEVLTDAGELFSFEIAFGQPYRSFYIIAGERGTVRVERAFTTPSDMAGRVEVCVEGCDESFSVAPCDHFLATIEYVCGQVRKNEWGDVHEQTRRLADLAEMIDKGCTLGDGI